MPRNTFQPDWSSAPGDTITDILRKRGLSTEDLAKSLGRTVLATENLLAGKGSITKSIADRLEEALGAPADFWMSRERLYRENLQRLRDTEKQWLTEIAARDILRFGWLGDVTDRSELTAACLRFFGVSSIRSWSDEYERFNRSVAFRTSRAFGSNPAALATWLRKGELEAKAAKCGPWSPERFQESLQNIKTLTRIKDPERFVPKLKAICAESGVAVVIARAPSGCRASGATHFLGPDKALLLLSFRHRSDDHFWFTFFHEAGHLLLHGNRSSFLDSDETLSRDLQGNLDPRNPRMRKEEEANNFASRLLIDEKLLREIGTSRLQSKQLIRFALRAGVSVGIVVGQLQHAKRLGPSQMNHLKRRYRWASDDQAIPETA